MSETISDSIYYHFCWVNGKTIQLSPFITGWEFLDSPEEDIYNDEP